MVLRRVVACLSWVVAAVGSPRYDIICDAGSTGTRMYLFKSTFSVDEQGKEVMTVSTNVTGKKKPGLSAYASAPADAVPPLLQLFSTVRGIIPQDYWAQTTVTILGTAGMRSLEPHQQQPIYDAVREGLTSSKEYVFSKDDSMLQLRSISGHEEGTFAMLCVNFLTGRLDHGLSLTDKGFGEKLLGILDLGGSSTQIAVPPTALAVGDKVPLGAGVPGSATVHSYAAYGMEQMRERVDKLVKTKKLEKSPCYFRGYQNPANGLLGDGDAKGCRQMLIEVFAGAWQECPPYSGADCNVPGLERMHSAGDGREEYSVSQAVAGGIEFLAVSGYLYVTDFATHWLSLAQDGLSGVPSRPSDPVVVKLKEAGNRPTIAEFEAATDLLCAWPWTAVSGVDQGHFSVGGHHRYTDATKAPHRCLEANYVAFLLEHAYGFPRDRRLVTFEDEIGDNEVEWPLGALLVRAKSHRDEL